MKLLVGVFSVLLLTALISCTKNPRAACGGASCLKAGMNDQAPSDTKLENTTAGQQVPASQAQQTSSPKIQNSGEQPKLNLTPEQLASDCATKAEDYVLSDEQVSKICDKANEYSENCMTRAFELGMHREDVASVCEHAKKGTVDCIAKALNNDMYSEEIPGVCTVTN